VVPKPKRKEKTTSSALMDAVCRKLGEAIRNVASNGGAAGPDRQSVDEVREFIGAAREKGLTGALQERDAPFGDYGQEPRA